MKMKYILASVAFTLSTAGAVAQEVKTDTLSTFLNPDKITIIETEKGSVIEVAQRDTVWRGVIDNKNEKPGNLSFRDYLAQRSNVDSNSKLVDLMIWGIDFSSKHDDKSKSDTNKKSKNGQKKNIPYYLSSPEVGGIGVGVNFANGANGFNIAPGKSYEVNWLYAVGYRLSFGSSAVTAGFGFTWRNYRLTDGTQFTADNGVLGLTQFSGDKAVRYSNLFTFNFQFPILFSQSFPSCAGRTRCEFVAGPILTVAAKANVTTRFFNEIGASEVWTGDITNQRRVGCDLFGAFGVPGLGKFYVRYSPFSTMRSGAPINFHSLSAGYIVLL